MSEPSDDEAGAFAPDPDSRRRHRRWFVDFETTVGHGGIAFAANAYDLSPGGACVELRAANEIALGDRVEFELPGYGAIAAEVRYAADGYLGLMFLHAAEDEIEIARYLVAIEQNRRPQRREVTLQATLRASGVDAPCVVSDLSRLGARVFLEETRHLAPGQEVTLEAPGIGAVAAAVQRVEDREVGLAFLEELPPEAGGGAG